MLYELPDSQRVKFTTGDIKLTVKDRITNSQTISISFKLAATSGISVTKPDKSAQIGIYNSAFSDKASRSGLIQDQFYPILGKVHFRDPEKVQDADAQQSYINEWCYLGNKQWVLCQQLLGKDYESKIGQIPLLAPHLPKELYRK